VAGGVMTGLADFGRLVGEEFGMITPMRDVTGQAVFLDGRVFPEEGPPPFRMALVAEFVCGIRRDHLGAESAMNVMAIRTFYLSFSDRVVRLPVLLGPDVQVTDKAKIRLAVF
jgi:hypothetical protein